jgi:hypothetical protein
MQDNTSWPLAPCLNISALKPATGPHPNMAELHRGYVAARAGLPLDPTESAAWREGWQLYRQTHPALETRIAACVTALRDARRQMELRPVPMPRVWPMFDPPDKPAA